MSGHGATQHDAGCPSTEGSCQCASCIEMNRFFSIIQKLPEKEQMWMEDFYSAVDGERLDADVNKAILEGSWPSAVEQLEESLRKAKITRSFLEQYGNNTGATTRSI